jgi:archaellum component FlaF (FlaF/FlaG flagellin family)
VQKTDETIVLLFDDATSEYNEHYDAYKLINDGPSDPSFYSQLNGKNYFMKAIAASDTQKVVVPLKVILKASGTQKIDVSEFENLEGIRVTLKHGDSETFLKPGVSYTFSSEAGTYDNFELIFGEGKTIKPSGDPESQNFRIWYRNNYLNVNFSGEITSESERMVIYDMNGTMIYNNKTILLIPGQTNQIAVPLRSGFYIADIVINNKHHRVKFVAY